MSRALLFRFVVCLFCFCLSLYFYLDWQNRLTSLKIQLPELIKEVEAVQEENQRIQYQIDRFETPSKLLELAQKAEFSHLKHPHIGDILTVAEGIALQDRSDDLKSSPYSISVTVGAK
jgi:hypothetical protein